MSKKKEQPSSYIPSRQISSRRFNQLARALLDSAIGPENKRLAQRIAAIEAEFRDNHGEMERDARRELLEQKLYDASLSHWETMQSKKIEAAKKLQRVSESWLRAHPPADRLYRLELAKARVATMSDGDVEDLLNAAADASDPQAIDVELVLAAAPRGDRTLARAAMDNVHVNAPWLNTREGAELARELALTTVPYGMVKLDPEVSGTADASEFDIRDLIGVE